MILIGHRKKVSLQEQCWTFIKYRPFGWHPGTIRNVVAYVKWRQDLKRKSVFCAQKYLWFKKLRVKFYSWKLGIDSSLRRWIYGI